MYAAVQACDVSVTTANTAVTTSDCSITFAQNDRIGAYSKTGTGSVCVCAIPVRYD